MKHPRYPSLYQVNTRVWITELSVKLGRPATLDDIPNAALDEFAATGFDWIWFLSVWTTGERGREISRDNPDWRQDFEKTLPDLHEEDIGGSGFAIADYKVHPGLGGDKALKRLRERLNNRGLKLMLDFVPNHMGPDHHWVDEHPDYFIAGTEDDLINKPNDYARLNNSKGELVLAYGRDPYFSGWPDTIQLDYSNPATVEAIKNELMRISLQCDGVRCDMAMLVLPDVFEKTWRQKAPPFWPEIIHDVKEKTKGFLFLAEVYWEMEWALQQEGFDYAYDKRLYDRLIEGHAKPVREHFYAGLDYQDKLARFLENHDEPRAAASFDLPKHEAAAVITFLSPGLRFFHQGQFEGRMKRISPHLVRAPQESINEDLHEFYSRLLTTLRQPVLRNGNWHLLECIPAWEGNGTWDSFIAFGWEGVGGLRILVTVNYSPNKGQCYLRLPFQELGNEDWRLQDLMSEVFYDRPGSDLFSHGLYLDMPAWGYQVFEIKKSSL